MTDGMINFLFALLLLGVAISAILIASVYPPWTIPIGVLYAFWATGALKL